MVLGDLHVAGLLCTDYSPLGLGLGTAGQSSLVLLVWFRLMVVFRGLRWRSFVPGMKSSDRPDRPDARETKSLAETRGAPGKRGGKPPGGAVRGSVGRGQPIPSTGSSARTASATGRHRGLKPAAESFTSTGHPGPGGAVAGPERHTKLDQRQHNPGSKQRLPQRAAGKR